LSPQFVCGSLKNENLVKEKKISESELTDGKCFAECLTQGRYSVYPVAPAPHIPQFCFPQFGSPAVNSIPGADDPPSDVSDGQEQPSDVTRPTSSTSLHLITWAFYHLTSSQEVG